MTLGNTRQVLMPCTKAPGTIASRDTAISVLLAARLSNVPRCEQRDSSSAGAEAQQFGSGGHEEAQSSWGGWASWTWPCPSSKSPAFPGRRGNLSPVRTQCPSEETAAAVDLYLNKSVAPAVFLKSAAKGERGFRP